VFFTGGRQYLAAGGRWFQTHIVNYTQLNTTYTWEVSTRL